MKYRKATVYKMKPGFKKRFAAFTLAAISLAVSAGCKSGSGNSENGSDTLQSGIMLEAVDVSGKTVLLNSAQSAQKLAAPTSLSAMDTEFTARDKDVGYEQSTATVITLEGGSAKISGSGASASNGDVIITAEGTFVISGTLDDGTLFVDAGETAKVQLVFDGANISCSDFAAVFIKTADKVFITLNEGKTNILSDGAAYILTEANSYVEGEQKNVDAVIFCRSDISINGSGILNVVGSYKHAIVSKDDLAITGGTINISAPNGGLYGSDSIKIGGGSVTITAGSDGIRADNNTEANRGFVYIGGGSVSVSAGSDGIQAATAIFIAGGTTLLSAEKAPIKCGSVAVISGGTLAALGGEFDCPISETSTQAEILFPFGTAVDADTEFVVAQNGVTSSLATFKALRSASVLLFTTPGLEYGAEYTLYKD